MKKPLLSFLLFALCFLAVERFCHKQTDGFRISKILSDLSSSPDREVSPLSPSEQENLKMTLSQRFYFLGSGGQAYAFLSEDKKSVLKVFKQHHLRTPAWFKLLPFASRLQKTREEKQSALFTSAKLAFDELQKESGLLFVHLNKSENLDTKIQLVDKLGIVHSLDADKLEFALQKKAILALPYIKSQVLGKHTEEAKQAISSLLQMLSSRSEKGIRDEDNGMRRNLGIVDGACITIDIGSFKRDPAVKLRSSKENELREKTWRLAKWLKKNDLSLWHYYEETLETLADRP